MFGFQWFGPLNKAVKGSDFEQTEWPECLNKPNETWFGTGFIFKNTAYLSRTMSEI